jgi:hypothetical protein
VTSYVREAKAHFVLQAPACYSEQDSQGFPEKSAPCGQSDPSGPVVPTGKVTTFHGGETITITIDEVVTHPGHYRVSLAADQNSLPADPAVTPGVMPGVAGATSTPCGTAVIETSPALPVVADGLLVHTEAFSGPQSVQVTLPNMSCTNCVLQVVEFMSDHGLNRPGGCFYHHCANVTIEATAVDAGASAEAGDFEASTAADATPGVDDASESGASSSEVGAPASTGASSGSTASTGGVDASVPDDAASPASGAAEPAAATTSSGGCSLSPYPTARELGPEAVFGLTLVVGSLRRRRGRAAQQARSFHS